MQYNLTSYEQTDVFHFALDEPKDRYPLLLVSVRKSYSHELWAAKILRAIKGMQRVKWN